MNSLRIVTAYESNKAYIAMFIVQAIYAGMALLSKASISSGMNPFIFVVYRQAFATLSLCPVAYFFERKNVAQLSYTLIWKIFFSSLIGITICLNMYYHALDHTSATFAAATTNLIPAITFVIALILSLIQSMVAAIIMERNLSSWKLGWDVNLLSVAYCGVIVTAFTYWLQLWSIEKRGPVFTAMFTPLALIITAIVSAFLWKETLYLGSVFGAVLLAGGLYCVLWGKSKEIEGKIIEQKLDQEETTLDSIKTQE
ncbi:putative EamA domain-containing protein [Helianthus annuus]|nr:putative EamA domain-containing protein [Helianthus annuus]